MSTSNNSDSLGRADDPETLSSYLTKMIPTSYEGVPLIWMLSGLVIMTTSLVYLTKQSRGTRKVELSRKAQISREMKKIYKDIETRNNSDTTRQQVQATGPKMAISQLYIYPIKSLRGCPISSATLTRDGFAYDRKFMLLRVHDDEAPRRLENMQVSKIASMALFHTSMEDSVLTVKYRSPGSSLADPGIPTMEIPLELGTCSNLEEINIDMYGSALAAFDMGPKYNEWFSQYFGFKVMLAYSGSNRRRVLGNLPGRPANEGPLTKSPIMQIICHIPLIGLLVRGQEDEIIAFNDVAPYLVITEASCADITSRLPADNPMDITKFRANVILSGSPSAFDEDYWGGLSFGDDKEIILTGNCGRCVSLNVDYETGTGANKGEGVLKLMMKDRRVDQGMKYSPIFGRYGFTGKRSEGKVLRIGDEVQVSKRNEERTRFYWPGLST